MKKIAFGLFLFAFAVAPAAVQAQKPCCGQKPAQKAKTGCTTCELAGTDTAPRATLTIRWKRLVLGKGEDKDKRTAPQHAATEQAVDRAFATLHRALSPLGVEVKVQKAQVSEASYKEDPLLSNRLWINGAALEMYLPKAKAGQVVDKDSGVVFRTVEFAGKSFRDIPADMIVQAGLIAAGESVKQALAEVQVLATAGKACAVGMQAATDKAKGDCCGKCKDDCCGKCKGERSEKAKGDCCEKAKEEAKATGNGDCCEKSKEEAKATGNGDCCEKSKEEAKANVKAKKTNGGCCKESAKQQ